MIIPNSVIAELYLFLGLITAICFGLNYLGNLMDKWLGIESED